MLDLIGDKTAEMTADQVSQTAGGAPAGAPPGGAPPAGGAPAQGMPAGDPAAMAAAAGGDPLAGMQQAPVTLEDAAKQGDPIAGALLQMIEFQKVILEQIATLLDNTGAQVPASNAVASQIKQIENANKVASAESMGSAANPGETGGLVLTTGLDASPMSGRGQHVASHWRKRS